MAGGTSEAQAKRLARLDELIAELDGIRLEAQSTKLSVRRKLFGEGWASFIRLMRVLSSQSWGPKVEEYLRNVHGWEKVDPKLARGDAKEKFPGGRHFEMKTTIITPTNTNANFVQIRPHHDIDGYQLFVVQGDYSVVHYYLTKEQMQTELDLLGTLAHGTVKGGGANMANAEWAIRFEWEKDSDVRKRWEAYEVGERRADSVCCVEGNCG